MNDPITSWLARLRRWVSLHPVAESRGHSRIADEIALALVDRGLSVTRQPHRSGDLLIARSMGSGPLLGVYGHYDVEPGGRTEMMVSGGRVFGRGVGDNLGPLALRLEVLERYQRRANLLWLIEPGEENGSHALGDYLGMSAIPRPDLWLDETGYFESGGSQRVLSMGMGGSLSGVVPLCAQVAAAHGWSTRTEERRLRRFVAEAGFNLEGLFKGVPYLAIGPNDDLSDVHGDQESLCLDTLGVSMRQFEVLLEMSSQEARP